MTRTADGDEGGKHHVFSICVSDGKLYIAKGVAGDKRWFRVGIFICVNESNALTNFFTLRLQGMDRELVAAMDSFSVV